MRPQEHGNHTDTRCLIMDNGLEFVADDKMEVCVSHYDTKAIQVATHTDELVKTDKTHIRVDYKDSGIGSRSCGPEIHERYRLREKDIHFSFSIKKGKAKYRR